MNRRGNISDVLFYTVMFFVVVVLAVTLGYGVNEFNTAIQNDTTLPADARTTMNTFNTDINPAMDWGLLFGFVAIHVGIIILGLFMKSHPVFYIVLFMAFVVILMLGAYLSNAYDDIASEAGVADIAELYPRSSWILDNYVMVMLIFGFIDIFVFVALNSFLDGGGV